MRPIFGSSLTKKLVMALAGLFLILFLLVHLSINLLILSDDPERYNRVAHFMASNPVIKVIEVVLMLSFLIHFIWGLVLQIQNWIARSFRYRTTHSSQTSFFSKYMIYTGVIILIFLILHFLNFFFVKLGLVEGDPENFYGMAYELFRNPMYTIIYLICFLILAFHLNHAFQSAFQTLGLNHPTYTPVIKGLGLLYSIVVPAGFSIIPIVICFFK
ncbi:MAG: succinate dehydrogenase cytochrome b subunit [Bacteroidales bacterium]|nr:MAG: succinate dehydrogenase cytochrome b subunit [Bacteroidales bacterium]